MEGKLVKDAAGNLIVEMGPDGKPKYRGSGKDMTYFDEVTREKFIPHVIEPSAGADRATLAFLCEAYSEDQAPDENGKMTERTVLKLHPRLAPIKAAVFPLVKKEGMPELAQGIYRSLKTPPRTVHTPACERGDRSADQDRDRSRSRYVEARARAHRRCRTRNSPPHPWKLVSKRAAFRIDPEREGLISRRLGAWIVVRSVVRWGIPSFTARNDSTHDEPPRPALARGPRAG